MPTATPSSASRCAVARPIPLAAPVTSATCPPRIGSAWSVGTSASFQETRARSADAAAGLVEQLYRLCVEALTDLWCGLPGTRSGMGALEHDAEFEAGEHHVPLDGAEVPRGVFGVGCDEVVRSGEVARLDERGLAEHARPIWVGPC